MTFELFLALLSPLSYGPVHIPRNFRAYRDAVLESLDEEYLFHGEAHFEHIIDPHFRADVESLMHGLFHAKNLEGAFYERGGILQLRLFEMAKNWHGYYKARYPEYAVLKRSFVKKFAFNCDPENPDRVLWMMGQLIEAPTESSSNAYKGVVVSR